MMEANFICYFCQASYTKNEHVCSSDCHALAVGVSHRDFCGQCRRILMRYFFRQMQYTKLRVEEN